jgi:hypothetical protein
VDEIYEEMWGRVQRMAWSDPPYCFQSRRSAHMEAAHALRFELYPEQVSAWMAYVDERTKNLSVYAGD